MPSTGRSEAQRAMARGAEPVGSVSNLPEPEKRLLRCLRLWMAEHDYQEQIWTILTNALGPLQARIELRVFDAYMSNVAVSIDRQIARHGVYCDCLGRDEATLLAIVRMAAAGDRSAAIDNATNLVREDRREPVVDAAEWLGQTMDPADIRTTTMQGYASMHATLH